MTFDDGSSIILGALQSYIFAQKLDPYGYKQWMAPVQVMYNASSFLDEAITLPFYKWGGVVSDGDGGMIHFWHDHRGAYDTGYEFKNNSIYAQRVDKFGIVRWTPDGLLIKGPETGKKSGKIVSDGQGGCIIAWSESGFGYPGAPNKERFVVARYNSNGIKNWEIVLDSSLTQGSISFHHIARGGNYIYAKIFRNALDFTMIFTLNGTKDSSFFSGRGGYFSWRDTIIFRQIVTDSVKWLKISPSKEVLWSSSIFLPGGCQGVIPFRNAGALSDDQGGMFYLYVCKDTIYHFDSIGYYRRKYFAGIASGSCCNWVFPDGSSGIVMATDGGFAQRYNREGIALWDSSFRFLSDAGNAYFTQYESDKNGGIITCFWTTMGGIYTQHSGRRGKVGIITNVEFKDVLPEVFKLGQNFPNPFNSSTTITYSLPRRLKVNFSIYNLIGKKITTLVDDTQEGGKHSIQVDLSSYSSGVYVYRLSTDFFVQSRKMIFLK